MKQCSLCHFQVKITNNSSSSIFSIITADLQGMAKFSGFWVVQFQEMSAQHTTKF